MCQKRITCLNNTLVFLIGALVGMLGKTGSTFFSLENVLILGITGVVFYFTHKYSESTLVNIKQLFSIF